MQQGFVRWGIAGAVVCALWSGSAAAATPEIRTTPANAVPACVTPDRLMRFIAGRNTGLDPRFADIAAYYKKHGEALGIRWDYAFYQMILETNYLMFMRGGGKPGDVRARQNNFAGIGATGGGVPGDSFPDVSTGVLAQMQHLIAYSGERVAAPVAKRTRENQDDIIAKSKRLGRPLKFADLTNRWAADGNYARSIEAVSDRFTSAHCTGKDQIAEAKPEAAAEREPKAAEKTERQRGRDGARKAVAETKEPVADGNSGEEASDRPTRKADKAGRRRGRAVARRGGEKHKAPPVVEVSTDDDEAINRQAKAAEVAERRRGLDFAKKAIDDGKAEDTGRAGLGAQKFASPQGACNVMAASYGGPATVLIRAETAAGIVYTALGVAGGAEQGMVDDYIKSHAAGGKVAGRFKSPEEAVAHAYTLCDSGKP